MINEAHVLIDEIQQKPLTAFVLYQLRKLSRHRPATIIPDLEKIQEYAGSSCVIAAAAKMSL